MYSKNVPKWLWDYGLVWVSEINNQMAQGPQECTPYEHIMGNTPNISEWLDFNFYDWCWFWNTPAHELMEDKSDLGWVLGVAHWIGSNMCYWVLTNSGQVLARTTVQRVTSDDLQNPTTQDRMHSYMHKITEQLDDHNHIIQVSAEGLVLDDKLNDENDEPEDGTQPKHNDYTDKAYNAYLGAKLLVPHGDTYITGRVTKHLRDDDRNPIGQQHTNPLLDTHQYQVQFGDGSIAEYTANLIAENLYAQCDPEGHYQLVFKEIMDHSR